MVREMALQAQEMPAQVDFSSLNSDAGICLIADPSDPKFLSVARTASGSPGGSQLGVALPPCRACRSLHRSLFGVDPGAIRSEALE
jgi:hypothetical protein